MKLPILEPHRLMALALKSRPWPWALAGLTLLGIWAWRLTLYHSDYVYPTLRMGTPPSTEGVTFNGTLGFEKIMVIGLPERSDKRDALSLMAAVTGIQLTWVNGERGADIVDKALPNGWDREKMKQNSLGSWRGHINAIRKIVEGGLSSALIMEDDMDWDVHIKPQLAALATGARELQSGFASEYADISAPSPYGQHWDMLWVGSCAWTLAEDLPPRLAMTHPDSRKWLFPADGTVAPPHRLHGNLSFSYDDFRGTRFAHVPGDNICSFAYALSQTGARKALEFLALDDVTKPFDNLLSDFCRLQPHNARCVGVIPPLFFHHRKKGKIGGDSDIDGRPPSQEVRKKGFTENILYSTRLNLPRLLVGLEPEKQWAD